MAEGKWIQNLKSGTHLADAARHVLTVRLEVVRDCLPLALHQAEQDPEHVHQLRVSTRRARAALDIFAGCLPAKEYKSARKQLRNVRRVAGEARDWDVFLASLIAWSADQGSRARRAIDCLIGYVTARRESAQVQLQEAGRGYPFTFDRFLAETVAAVHKPQDPHCRCLLDLAHPRLTDLLHWLDDSLRGDLQELEHLHAVRIIGKRLRYAMEIFADCFAPAFRERLYPQIEEMQEVLGNVNDSHVACLRLEALGKRVQASVPAEWKRLRPGFDALVHFHEARLPVERERFEQWMSRWREPAGEASFFALLKEVGGDSPPAIALREGTPPAVPDEWLGRPAAPPA